MTRTDNMYPEPKADLSVELCGVRLESPFILAAAPPTDDAEMVRDALRAGWAGAVLKTTAIEGTDVPLAYPMMSGSDLGERRLAAMGNIDLISRHHIAEIEGRIAALKGEFPEKRIICSISGQDRQSWRELASRAAAAGSDLIEASFSCPQGQLGLAAGAMLGQDASASAEVAGWIKGAADGVPVIIKLTPQVADIAAIARAVRAAGADGVCLANTVPAIMGVNLDRRPETRDQRPETGDQRPLTIDQNVKPSVAGLWSPVAGRRFQWTPIPNVGGFTTSSGLSGPAIKPIALRCVALVARGEAMPIVGSGGAETWRDVLEFLLMGATAVELCTAVMHYGISMIEDLKEGLALHLDRWAIGSVRDVIGRALPTLVSHDGLPRGGRWRPAIAMEECVRCGACVISCRDGGHRAIAMDGERRPAVADDKCAGCGLCSVVCPACCIEMRHEPTHP